MGGEESPSTAYRGLLAMRAGKIRLLVFSMGPPPDLLAAEEG